MTLILAYPFKVTQLETDYEFFFNIIDDQFKKDILRQSIEMKSEVNICPLTNETNNYATFSSSGSLNQLSTDITPDAFIETIRTYFDKMLLLQETPTPSGYIAFLREEIERSTVTLRSTVRSIIKLKF